MQLTMTGISKSFGPVKVLELPSCVILKQGKTRSSATDDVEGRLVIEAGVYIFPTQLNNGIFHIVHPPDRGGYFVPTG